MISKDMEKKISTLTSIKTFIRQYRSIFFIFGLAAASIVGVVHIFNISNDKNVELITQSSIKSAQKAYIDLELNMENMLTATLESLSTNTQIAEVFIARDWEKLYKLCRPIYDTIRHRNSVTHWYFVTPEPERRCFLRVHNPNLYGDQINRITLTQSIQTKKITTGNELGKTAFALRAVRPYYYRDRLIGYMELGIQAEDFLEILKKQTGNEYSILLFKKYVKREDWNSIVNQRSLKNTWDDMKYLLQIYATSKVIQANQFMQHGENIKNIPDEGLTLEKIHYKEGLYVRGIFPIYDALGSEIGGVFFLKDISPIFNAMQKQKKQILLLILLFMGIVTFFMFFFHKRAERELRIYRNRLEDMVKENTAELIETNSRLYKEIEMHKDAQLALEQECRARTEAEKKQIEAVKHAERSARLASIGVMAASITHEINQPLNAIKVTADSIQYWHKRNPGILPDVFTNQLQIISKSVKRIVEIIEHMRTFWVLPNTPEISEVSLNKAVQNALSLTRQQLHAHGIKETLKMDLNPLMVKGNMIHFEQIIVNLVVNAIHALDEKKKRKNKSIEIRTFLENGWGIMIIDDNGPGLPSVDPDKLFDPFFSTRQGDEGMGLGLAIVKRYIDQYNGTIQATNNEEGGARFTIRFLLIPSDTSQLENQQITRPNSNEFKPVESIIIKN